MNEKQGRFSLNQGQPANGGRLCKGRFSFPRDMRRPLLILISIFTCFSAVFGWGRTVHYYVNYEAVKAVPEEMADFRQYAAWIASHASDPDKWKSYLDDERFRHYMDLDRYGEYPFKDVPRGLDTLIKKYGRKIVRENGILPWTIKNKYNRLIALMKAGEWKKALHVAAALGHYVGDAHQPFHSTDNFNGQNTDNVGIHFRYESNMVMKYEKEIKRDSNQPLSAKAAGSAPKQPEEIAFNYLIESYKYVENIIAADSKNKKYQESDENKYYEMLWKDTGLFTVGLINKAADNLAYSYYFAWAEAGKPKIPSIDPAELTNVKNRRMWQEIFYDEISGTTAAMEIYDGIEFQDHSHPDYIAHPPVIP